MKSRKEEEEKEKEKEKEDEENEDTDASLELTDLPPEMLSKILGYLDRRSLMAVCLTNRLAVTTLNCAAQFASQSCDQSFTPEVSPLVLTMGICKLYITFSLFWRKSKSLNLVIWKGANIRIGLGGLTVFVAI